jgi:hypothetical protein
MGGGVVVRVRGTDVIRQDWKLVYRTGLPHEVKKALTATKPDEILVMNWHAWRQNSEKILKSIWSTSSCQAGLSEESICWIILETKIINSGYHTL